MNQAEFKDLQKEFRRLSKTFDALAAPQFSQPEFLEELEKALKKLPTPVALSSAVTELKERVSHLLKSERAARTERFSRIEAEFIRSLRGQNMALREYDSSWRIGPLEMEIQRAQARVRFSYNQQPMTGWTPVKEAQDLEKLQKRALASLDRYAIDPKELVGLCFAAHAHLTRRRSDLSLVDESGLVPILDFLREFRIQLVRSEMAGAKPDKKLQSAEFPLWALLYNLDRYRDLGSGVPKEKRIGFQTGSQREQATGRGVLLNGLRPDLDHQAYCFVIRAR